MLSLRLCVFAGNRLFLFLICLYSFERDAGCFANLQGRELVLLLPCQQRAAQFEIVGGIVERSARLSQGCVKFSLGLRQTPDARQHYAEIVMARRKLFI